jgi:hypothetical protein
MWQIPDQFDFTPTQEPLVKGPIIEHEEEKKKLFGVELAQTGNAFQAACNVCGQNTNEAVWISRNWLHDPIVLASKQIYLESIEEKQELLDKDAIARKLLEIVDERNSSGTLYILDGKDRLKGLEIYSKLRGYLDNKVDPRNSNFVHNKMVIRFVKPEENNNKELKEKITNNDQLVANPLKIRLVK